MRGCRRWNVITALAMDLFRLEIQNQIQTWYFANMALVQDNARSLTVSQYFMYIYILVLSSKGWSDSKETPLTPIYFPLHVIDITINASASIAQVSQFRDIFRGARTLSSIELKEGNTEESIGKNESTKQGCSLQSERESFYILPKEVEAWIFIL